MASPLQSSSEFLNHYFMSKIQTKHEMYLKVDSMVEGVYEHALDVLQQFFVIDQSTLTAMRMDTSSESSHSPVSDHDQSDTPQNVADLTDISVDPTSTSHLNQKQISMNFKSKLPPKGTITFYPCSTGQSSSTSPSPPVSITNFQITETNELTNIESNEIPFDSLSTGQSSPTFPVPPPSPVSSEDEQGTDEQEIEDDHFDSMNTQSSHSELSLENANHSIDVNSQINSAIETPHIDEINDFVNDQLESQQNDDLINSSSSSSSSRRESSSLFPQSINPSNDQLDPQQNDEPINSSSSSSSSKRESSLFPELMNPQNVQFPPQLNVDDAINSSSSSEHESSSLFPQSNNKSNVQLERQLNVDDSINSASASTHEPSLSPQPMNPSILEFPDSVMHQQQPDQLSQINHNADDDCVIENQVIDEQQESSPPVKKRKRDQTQPSRQSERIATRTDKLKQTDQTPPAEVNNHNPNEEGSSQAFNSQPTTANNSRTKQVTTVRRQCPNCPKSFPKDQLNDHIKSAHSIGPFRCLLKDCGQTFDNRFILRDHIMNAHHQTTEWHCDKCPKHFTIYKQLSTHYNEFHQLGHFQCSYPQCTFTANLKAKVRSHCKRNHKRTQFHCEHCHYKASDSYDLKQHQRTHSGAKPYRCKWPECQYAAAILRNTVNHIRRKHFASPNSSSSPDGAQQLGQPKDYVEVLTDLL